MTPLFISDLHLDDARPEVTEAFLALLDGPARESDTLYILGDLFDSWIGDAIRMRAIVAIFCTATAISSLAPASPRRPVLT